MWWSCIVPSASVGAVSPRLVGTMGLNTLHARLEDAQVQVESPLYFGDPDHGRLRPRIGDLLSPNAVESGVLAQLDSTTDRDGARFTRNRSAVAE